MSDQEREQITEEEREETFEDLDVPEEQSADVAGGRKAGKDQEL